MNSQIKSCQNCKKEFEIQSEDFNFYNKIKVPPPTFCPECRLQRRLVWYNLRSLYKRNCDRCKKGIVSIYHSDSPFTVYCSECYFSDAWDASEYAREYDFSRNFFQQWRELLLSVPRLHLEHVGNNGVGCEYANHTYKSSFVYLSFICVKSEHIAYSALSRTNKNCADCYNFMGNEYCYDCVGSNENHTSAFLTDCMQCISSEFLYDCINCQNCFMSANLRNKQYVFYGEQLTKDAYKKAIIELKAQKSMEVLRDDYATLMEKAVHRYSLKRNAIDSSGNLLINVKNVRDSFDVYESDNCRFSSFGSFRIHDSYDIVSSGRATQCYECMESGRINFNCLFSYNFGDTHDISYSHGCNSIHDIFGCIGLEHKPYSILNKQYTKEEYETLVPKIISHMNEMPYTDTLRHVYRYGEFVPSEFSPFAYNETDAFEKFPLEKDETIAQGYQWRDNVARDNTGTITKEERDGSSLDALVKEILPCDTIHENPLCSKAFRLVEDEVLLLKRFGYKTPKHCPNCRYLVRRDRSLPYQLWHRSCMCEKENHDHRGKCSNEFETSYAPERPEIIYCEKCYQSEVL